MGREERRKSSAISSAMARLGSPRALGLCSVFLPLIVVSSLCICARSEHPTTGETIPAIRLPSEGGAASEEGVCARAPSSTCPVRCFRTDPVCGADGVTYWCGCAEAACAGVRVAKLGFCDVGNGGNGLVSGQALLLVHIVWLIVLGFSVVCGLF